MEKRSSALGGMLSSLASLPWIQVFGLSIASWTRRLKRANCSGVPWASQSTDPSYMFFTQPVTPACSAQASTVNLKPTACTLPV